MTKVCFGLIFCVTLTSAPVLGGVYKWTDTDGTVHFGDRPPADAGTESVDIRPNTYAAPEVSVYTPDPSDPAPAAAVTIFTIQGCGYCKAAKRHFQQQDIAYKEYDIQRSDEARRKYQRQGATGVPVILVGDRRLNGFSAEAFDRLYTAAARH